MKLSEYAKRNGITYQAAFHQFKAGKIAGAYRTETGRIMVPEPEHSSAGKAVVYARVADIEQREELKSQADLMAVFAFSAGLDVIDVVAEIGPGVNDSRSKLAKLLQRDDWSTLVVSQKSRLTPVGFGWMELLLAQQGRNIVVADLAQEETSDLMSEFKSIARDYAVKVYGVKGSSQRASRVMGAMAEDAAKRDQRIAAAAGGGMSVSELAAQYGMGEGYIKQIINAHQNP